MKREDKRQIIRLARSGSPERAWLLLMDIAQGLDGDPDVLILKGRLLKDRAKRADGSEAAALYAEAADLYEQAAHQGNVSYPLINAASLALLAGQARRCEKLARRVLEVIESDPDEAETPYWHAATRAEALLLLDEEVDARAALARAMQRAPQAWEDHAATIGQMQLICREKGMSCDWLGRLRPPRSLHFAGIIGIDPQDDTLSSRVSDWLESENVGFGWGALAAGADIVIAEALLARGAQLNAVLPCPVDQFRKHSVEPAGQAWSARFDKLLQECETLEILDHSASPDQGSVDLAESYASGLALHNAQNLQSEAVSLRVVENSGTQAATNFGLLRGVEIPARPVQGLTIPPVKEQGRLRIALLAGGKDSSAPLQLFDTPEQAWTAAGDILASGETAALGHCYVSADEKPDGGLQQHLAQLASMALPSTAMSSRAIGFALRAADPAIHVEAHGELRSAQGLFPICSLR